ncbi:MAG: helicase-related protein, partial [Polyangiaceae bacterium]
MPTRPINYPFHLLLTSATIPTSLNNYLANSHPALVRLASPRLHKLPKSLQTEYVAWSGGNKFADILRRLKKVWAEDAMMVGSSSDEKKDAAQLSKVLVFCNKTTKALELSRYLEEQGVANMPVTSQAGLGQRERFSNRHLEGFLRVRAKMRDPRSPASPAYVGSAPSPASASDLVHPTRSEDKDAPKVLITTSLLSRGLDFSPEIKHVFIIDEPRNMVDFLHRAGRAGRAGEKGRVVVFG